MASEVGFWRQLKLVLNSNMATPGVGTAEKSQLFSVAGIEADYPSVFLDP
jgi:hypothetical protein